MTSGGAAFLSSKLEQSRSRSKSPVVLLTSRSVYRKRLSKSVVVVDSRCMTIQIAGLPSYDEGGTHTSASMADRLWQDGRTFAARPDLTTPFQGLESFESRTSMRSMSVSSRGRGVGFLSSKFSPFCRMSQRMSVRADQLV